MAKKIEFRPCAATVREVTVGFSAEEMKRLESQAFVRGCDVPPFIRAITINFMRMMHLSSQ